MTQDKDDRKAQQKKVEGAGSELPANRSMPEAVVIPELAYAKVDEAVTWLCEVFGFEERLRIGNHRAQLRYKQGAVIVTELGEAKGGSSEGGRRRHSIMVRVEDVDGHYERAAAGGARILSAPTDYAYGERQYSAEDLGGHVWTFSQTIEDVDPASWGGRVSK